MKSKNILEQKNVFCPECGLLIAVNAILINNHVSLKYIFCPECGKKVEFKNYSIKAIDNAQLTDKNYKDDKLESAIELIIYDKDFTQRFKNTYLLFIARMSYVKLKELEKEINTPILQMELTTDLIDTIEARLAPIITKKPILNVLKYLGKANYSEFFSDLKRYQKKILKIKKYRKALFVYLRWIIEIVFKIMNQIDTEEGLFNHEKAIRDDLVQFFGLETRGNVKEKELNKQGFANEGIIQEDNFQKFKDVNKKKRSPIEERIFSKVNSNELILIYDFNSNLYRLVEMGYIENYKDSYVFGLDENFQLKEIKIEGKEILPSSISLNITCKHGILSLSEQHKLLTVDENLNIIQIPANNLKEGTPILMPRVIYVIEDDSPLDFSNCGDILVENDIEYVKKAFTKAFRFVEKSYELGYVLGHYCSEGSMKKVSISCGTNKAEMEKVANLVYKNFGFIPVIGIAHVERSKPIYSVDSNTVLAKSIFTKGLRLKPKSAPFKEIPPFLYNAPIECVKGFIAAFLEGDGSETEYTREDSSRRDVLVRFFTSSRKLVFGLNFLLKRLGVVTFLDKREFDDIEHPTWYDAYTLNINGKKNLAILREFIPSIPEIGHFARDIEPVLYLNPWMKKLNIELKENYGISLRMLSEKGKIPNIAYKCAQQNSTMNISESKLLDTLNFLIKKKHITPTSIKLWNLFERNTFTKIKKIEVNDEFDSVYYLSVPFYDVYIAGIGQIYFKN